MKLFGTFLDFFGNCWEFFGGIFWEKFFGRIFLGGFLGGFFWEGYWEDFFGRNSLFILELTCLSRFWFLSRFWGNGEGRISMPERIYNPITAMGFSAMFTFQLDNTKR